VLRFNQTTAVAFSDILGFGLCFGVVVLAEYSYYLKVMALSLAWPWGLRPG